MGDRQWLHHTVEVAPLAAPVILVTEIVVDQWSGPDYVSIGSFEDTFCPDH